MGVVTLKKKCQQPKLSHSSQGYVSEGADDGQGEPPPSSLPPLAKRRWSRARQLGAQEPGQARLAACTARAAQLGALHTSHICMDGEREEGGGLGLCGFALRTSREIDSHGPAVAARSSSDASVGRLVFSLCFLSVRPTTARRAPAPDILKRFEPVGRAGKEASST